MLKILAIPLLLVLLISCKEIEKPNIQQKPNIIFIMADDLGWQDVGFMGSQWFETPNLDKLASESLVFKEAYMYPTCSPSRAALLTGRQSFRTGIYNVPVLERGDNQSNIFSRWTVGLEHPVYAAPLKKAGYSLIHLGKWHIVGPNPQQETNYPFTKPLRQPANGTTDWVELHKSDAIQQFYPIGKGFQENVGGTWWGDPARGYQKGYQSESGGYTAPFKNPFIEAKENDEWLTDRLTDETIAFMERNKESPFFVNLHFYAPHRPTKIRNQKLLEKVLVKAADTITGQGEKNRQEIAAYATMIASIDENVQRIVTYLEKHGLRENTLIIFTSDNGYNVLQSANKRLRGAKGHIYEGGLRVPAFANWPGKIKAGINKTPISGLDYFPTFLELAGIDDYQNVLDGESLVPLLNGSHLKDRALFWHLASTYINPPCSIIRKGKWKLIQFLNSEKVELYNLEDDLKESRNLVELEKEISEKLLAELSKWRKENHVPLPPISKLPF